MPLLRHVVGDMCVFVGEGKWLFQTNERALNKAK